MSRLDGYCGRGGDLVFKRIFHLHLNLIKGVALPVITAPFTKAFSKNTHRFVRVVLLAKFFPNNSFSDRITSV